MRRKWEEEEGGWHKLPPRAWPAVQPKPDELGALKAKAMQQQMEAASATPATLCAAQERAEQAAFDLATCLTFNNIDPTDGLRRFRALAEGGNVDAMVAVGTVLLEGIGCESDEAAVSEGLDWMRAASEREHPQALYELGCLHYLGRYLPADEGAACALFEAAARKEHTSALFMVGEALLNGEGCAVDGARAVRLFHEAAQRGHRMARQYITTFLDDDAVQHGTKLSPQALAQRHAEKLPVMPAASEHFAVFRGDGEPVSLSDLVDGAAECDVVLLGECHDDRVAHELERYVLTSLAARRASCTLSLEMFERDTQLVLDEYLAGLIREEDLLQDARPWANYASDYRPLVEFAKDVGLRVVAANAPRRYVGAVGRRSQTTAEDLWPSASFRLLPPLPLPTPSKMYLKHLHEDPAVVRTDQLGFEPTPAANGGDSIGASDEARCPYIGLAAREGLEAPMLLWDSAMAMVLLCTP